MKTLLKATLLVVDLVGLYIAHQALSGIVFAVSLLIFS
jgi:hypothetical protein